jgi:hypothetical protein
LSQNVGKYETTLRIIPENEDLKILYVSKHRTPTDVKMSCFCDGVHADRRLLECDETFLRNVSIIRPTTRRHSNLHDRWFYLYGNPCKTTQIYVIRMCMEDPVNIRIGVGYTAIRV